MNGNRRELCCVNILCIAVCFIFCVRFYVTPEGAGGKREDIVVESTRKRVLAHAREEKSSSEVGRCEARSELIQATQKILSDAEKDGEREVEL